MKVTKKSKFNDVKWVKTRVNPLTGLGVYNLEMNGYNGAVYTVKESDYKGRFYITAFSSYIKVEYLQDSYFIPIEDIDFVAVTRDGLKDNRYINHLIVDITQLLDYVMEEL